MSTKYERDSLYGSYELEITLKGLATYDFCRTFKSNYSKKWRNKGQILSRTGTDILWPSFYEMWARLYLFINNIYIYSVKFLPNIFMKYF